MKIEREDKINTFTVSCIIFHHNPSKLERESQPLIKSVKKLECMEKKRIIKR